MSNAVRTIIPKPGWPTDFVQGFPRNSRTNGSHIFRIASGLEIYLGTIESMTDSTDCLKKSGTIAAVFEAVALAVHFRDVSMMGQPTELRTCKAFRS